MGLLLTGDIRKKVSFEHLKIKVTQKQMVSCGINVLSTNHSEDLTQTQTLQVNDKCCIYVSDKVRTHKRSPAVLSNYHYFRFCFTGPFSRTCYMLGLSGTAKVNLYELLDREFPVMTDFLHGDGLSFLSPNE